MRVTRPVLLNAMDQENLAAAALDRRWPKWATMCQLRSLGCPVLNGICVMPGAGMTAVREAVNELAGATNTDRLMVRSDGGRETRAYYRGGNSFPIDQIEGHAGELLATGRAVILLEPTDRRTNRLSVLLRMDRPTAYQSGTFSAEALGSGYDVGDLTRGGIQPQITVSINEVTWDRYSRPWWNDLKVNCHITPAEERVRRGFRLARLAQLDGIFASSDQDTAAATQNLRIREGLTAEVIRSVPDWFDVAFVAAATHPNRSWRCLAISLSDLGDGRTVYWDIVDSAHKYAMTFTDRRHT